MENKKDTTLVVMHLNAAFNMVDHQIFLDVLNSRFGIEGTAFSWFLSCLKECQFYVSIYKHCSHLGTLPYGAPQGNCAGPTAFTAYSSTLEICTCRKMMVVTLLTGLVLMTLWMITNATKPPVHIPVKLNKTQLESWNTAYMTFVTG